MNARPCLLVLALAAAPVLGGPLPDDAALLWEDATVLAAVDDHRSLDVAGLVGTIALRRSKDGELRYAARTLDNQRSPVPVALWSDGRRLFLRPAAGDDGRPVLVEIALSPGLHVTLDARETIVRAGGIEGDVTLRGAGLDVDLRNVRGAVELEFDGATLAGDGLGRVSLSGGGVEGSLSNLSDEIDVTLEGSTLALRSIVGLEADVSDSSLLVDGAEQAVRIEADASGVALGSARRGARLVLRGSPLTLADCEGDLDVETDESVEFSGLKGNLAVVHSGFESSVRGRDSAGGVLIEMQVGEIALTKIAGPVQIQGVELVVTLEGLGGELTMVTEASRIEATALEGKATIHNTLGDVRISGSKQPVEIVSSGGSVVAEQIGGSLQVWGDGELIEADWATIAVDTRGHLENASGGVVARLPTSARCRVEAETTYGTIESSVPGLEPDGDGTTLQGALHKGQGGTISIKAAGDVRLAHRGK